MKAVDFLRGVRVELSKVVWPSRQATLRLTILVIVITIIVGFFIGLIDLSFSKGMSLLLG
jgi:preprotein translocase subunit SecE